MIGALEERLNREYIQYDNNLRKFKSKVRKPDGKLTLSDIAKLDNVKRRYYIDQIMQEQESTNAYVQVVQNTVLDKETEVVELIWGINDMNSQWQQQSDAIMLKIADKIAQLGVNKNSYTTRFSLPDIYDMQKELATCKNCMNGLACEKHNY